MKDLLKSCFKVEDEAARIKGKYLPKSKNANLFSTVGLAAFSDNIEETPKPLKTSTLSKQEKLVLASATNNADQAEDAMLALQLLQ